MGIVLEENEYFSLEETEDDVWLPAADDEANEALSLSEIEELKKKNQKEKRPLRLLSTSTTGF